MATVSTHSKAAASPAAARGRRLARGLVAVATLLLLASWVRPLPRDDGWLLELAGHPVDLAGRARGLQQRLLRQCGAVQRWPAGSPRWLEAQAVLAAYSPPASAGAEPVQLLGSGQGDGEWLLAEVRWDARALDPAIVALRRQGAVLQVQAQGVWSGDTAPWWAPVVIRRYLATQLPAMPRALALCLDPTLPPFER